VPKLVLIALTAAALLVAWQSFGALAGAIAALLVASNAFFRWLGTTLYLDGLATLFLLLFLWSLVRAFREPSAVRFAGAGLFLGLAFLTKETAALWLPLPLAFFLLSAEHRNGPVLRGLGAYGLTAGALLGGWWLWAYLVTERVYLWGKPDAELASFLLVAIAALALLGGGGVLVRRLAPRLEGPLASAAGMALVAGWAATVLVFLEVTGWAYPREHWTTVPRYLWTVAAPNTQPWPLVALGVAWLAWRSRREPEARLLALGLALFVPLAIWIANREHAYRNLLPMTYVAYIGAAALAAHVLQGAAERSGAIVWAGAVAGLAAIAIVQTQELQNERLAYERPAVDQSDWDNALVHDTAAWLQEHVPAGAGVMSSRLYFSHFYVLDEAAHPVYQLPTVRLEPSGGERPFLRPVTTLFRWEDHRLQVPEEIDWIYVQRYPSKGYYIGLSEQDLLRDLRERQIDYLVLTGEDAGFSSLSYLDYFTGNPAFELVHADRRDHANGVSIFRVDRSRLAPRPYRAVMDEETLAALGAIYSEVESNELQAAIDPDGIEVRG
jgi:hypothetical protein